MIRFLTGALFGILVIFMASLLTAYSTPVKYLNRVQPDAPRHQAHVRYAKLETGEEP